MKKFIIILSLFLLILQGCGTARFVRKVIPNTPISSYNSVGIVFKNSSSVYVSDVMDEMLRLRNWIETDIVENSLFVEIFKDKQAAKAQILMIIEPITYYKVKNGSNMQSYMAAYYLSPLFLLTLKNSRFAVNIKLYDKKTKNMIAETTVTSEEKSGQGTYEDMNYSVDIVAEKVKEFLLECGGVEKL